MNTILSDPADRTSPDNRPARLAQPGMNAALSYLPEVLAATDEPGGDDFRRRLNLIKGAEKLTTNDYTFLRR